MKGPVTTSPWYPFTETLWFLPKGPCKKKDSNFYRLDNVGDDFVHWVQIEEGVIFTCAFALDESDIFGTVLFPDPSKLSSSSAVKSKVFPSFLQVWYSNTEMLPPPLLTSLNWNIHKTKSQNKLNKSKMYFPQKVQKGCN